MTSALRGGALSLPPAGVVLASRVLCAGEPSTVARLVIPVVVDPVNLVIEARPLAHVFEEVNEVVPSLAHADAPAAVVPPRCVARITAPAEHPAPRPVRWRVRPAVLVRRRSRAGVFGEPCSRIGSVVLSLHRVSRPRVMPGAVFSHPVTALVDCSKFATTAGTKLRRKSTIHASHSRGFGWLSLGRQDKGSG